MEQLGGRPSDNQEQKRYSSGKKNQHRFKNQFVNLPEEKDIVDVEVGEKGPSSDISLFREQQEKFHNNQRRINLRTKVRKQRVFHQGYFC